MSDLTRALESILPRPRNATTARTAIPVGTSQVQPAGNYKFETYAREGYSQNELVYACIEARATSAAEPIPAVWLKNGTRAERHPALDLLKRPNPFLSGYSFVAGMIMYRDIGGTAPYEIVFSRARKPVELWPIRPDRLTPIPDPNRYLAGWHFQAGAYQWDYPADEIGVFKTRNPLDDYRGLPPLAPVAARVDIDNWMRQFVSAFFRNAGVPAGLLTVEQELDDDMRQMIQNRFRNDTGGPGGWHSLLLLEGANAKYEPMGQSLGQRGLIVDEMVKVSETRVAMPFGVPLSILGALIGQESSSYANRKADKSVFWEDTLAPLYRDLSDSFTLHLGPHFPDVERIGFDLSTVQALQPDIDKRDERTRANAAAGLITREEGRLVIGYPAEAEIGHTWVMSGSVTAVPVGQESPEPTEPEPTNGKVVAV